MVRPCHEWVLHFGPCKNSQLSSVTYKLKQFLITTWSRQYFHFFCYLNSLIFTVLLKAYQHWTLQTPLYLWSPSYTYNPGVFASYAAIPAKSNVFEGDRIWKRKWNVPPNVLPALYDTCIHLHRSLSEFWTHLMCFARTTWCKHPDEIGAVRKTEFAPMATELQQKQHRKYRMCMDQ